MATVELTVPVRWERKGLMLTCHFGKYFMKTIDLQEYWGLSDDNAQYILKKLDESDKQKEEKPGYQ